ncbi:hypothetical protein D3C71_78110 [compost metagenome]
MYALKGFIAHSLMAINAPGQVAKIGELSPNSATYSREKGFYAGGATAPNQMLIGFLSETDGLPTEASVDAVTHVHTIAKFVYDKILAGTQIYADELLIALIETFPAAADNFECGPIVSDDEDRNYAPEWLSWKSKVPSLGTNNIKIWFVDDAFASQYDEFEILVVPPMDNLNDFFKTGTQVEALLKLRTISQTADKIQQAKGGKPETIVRIDQYDYVDPLNNAHRVPSTWGILIYGAAGNNIDSIKDALVDYILENSDHTREEWTPILPDIFKRTEFVLIPRWDQYAIPNRETAAGIYSPFANLSGALAKLKALITNYPESHINSHGTAFGHPYKSLNILACGGPENRDDKFKLTDVVADWIAVSSTSIDFNRMTQATQGWALLLGELLLHAEAATEFSTLPFSMTKTKRNGILYVVASYDNIHYLVAAKSSIDV